MSSGSAQRLLPLTTMPDGVLISTVQFSLNTPGVVVVDYCVQPLHARHFIDTLFPACTALTAHIHHSAGNWGAIILGVTVTTLGLVTVVAAGCYSDLRSLATGHHRRIPKAAQRSGAGEARWPPQPDLLQQPSSNGLHTRATR